ncbi:hypothetical protein BaRGS_00030202, partial [Batillaria attramentaria]
MSAKGLILNFYKHGGYDEPPNPYAFHLGVIVFYIFLLIALVICSQGFRSPVLLLTKPEKTLFTHEYIVAVKTSSLPDAGLTPDATVQFYICGVYGNSRTFYFCDAEFQRDILQPGGLDIFVLHSKVDLGELKDIRFTVANTSSQPEAS